MYRISMLAGTGKPRTAALSHQPRRRAQRPGAIGRAAQVLLAALIALPQAVTPATITVDGADSSIVPGNGVCSLREAINNANTNTDTTGGDCIVGDDLPSGGDTIELTRDVTLTVEDNPLNGLPVISTDVTIAGNDHTIARESTAPDFRLLEVASDGTLTLNRATVSGGSVPNGRGKGGGILTYGATTLTDSTLSHNFAHDGGGGINISSQFNHPATTTLTRTAVTHNTANGSGGGIHKTSVFSSTTLTDSTVSYNSTLDGEGGGFWIYGGNLDIANSTISNNSAEGERGVAILSAGFTTITNSTISGNDGGVNGIAFFYYEMTVKNSTLFDNSAMNLYAFFGGIRLYDSIVAGGTCNYLVRDLSNNFTDSAGCPGDPITTGVDFEVALADNGGPTQTHALLPGSVAIDAAQDCGLETDQRGVPRDDGSCDSGSYEFVDETPSLQLSASGTCPGEVQAELSGATPNGLVILLRGRVEGSFVLPAGSPCEGTVIDLEDPTPLATGPADGQGERRTVRTLSEASCGLKLQAVDAARCATSNVLQMR